MITMRIEGTTVQAFNAGSWANVVTGASLAANTPYIFTVTGSDFGTGSRSYSVSLTDVSLAGGDRHLKGGLASEVAHHELQAFRVGASFDPPRVRLLRAAGIHLAIRELRVRGQPLVALAEKMQTTA